MRGLMLALALALTCAATACDAEAGDPGAPPLSIGTMVAFPPLLPVGVQGMMAVTMGNVGADERLSYAWAVEPAELAVPSPSACPVLFFAPLAAGEYEVRVSVSGGGDRVADGLMRVRAASVGSGAAQTDADLDGLFDAWEVFFFGGAGGRPIEDVRPGADPDGDQRDNLREQEDGTDPTVRDEAPVARGGAA